MSPARRRFAQALSVAGLVTGCVYALTACGLVVTHITSGVFNFAHGAIGMLSAFVFWELTVARGLPPLPALLLTVLVVAPLVGALVERLLVRYEELQRTNELLVQQVGALTQERDSLRSRLSAARARVDALLERLPETRSA